MRETANLGSVSPKRDLMVHVNLPLWKYRLGVLDRMSEVGPSRVTTSLRVQ
jgi:hypothetical protein